MFFGVPEADSVSGRRANDKPGLENSVKTAKKYRLIFTDMPHKPLKTKPQYGTIFGQMVKV